MEFEKAIALAMMSSWDELVKSNDENCTLRVEYRDISGTSLECLKVWFVRKNGLWVLVCNYSIKASHSSQDLRFSFANSYQSEALTQSIDYIMQNQLRFSRRAAGSSMKGMVEVGPPNQEERANAVTWRKAITDNLAKEKSTPYAKRN
ncbi:MAG TPA: hypothetical protein VK738_21110 [Terriglobales bacterium]|jgi:hypothetical protein|nr:hypothetical protein [Terriglobales bacterium]